MLFFEYLVMQKYSLNPYIGFAKFCYTKSVSVSGKKNQAPVSRSNSRYMKNASITRSRSSGVLNQSDSDPETQEKKVSRLMRPTISSHNKISNKMLQNRKKHSYSTSKFVS